MESEIGGMENDSSKERVDFEFGGVDDSWSGICFAYLVS